ncbi:Nitrous oxidase accessory protein NosD, contains tandem CASH domains [Kytococcus aerolatus]|uniref:Nitrous oxidase accessory protein NosD, contains tandem CASH domains n=1 Tax=Kytococcus aerolatus TaxID=592308 RepID=A0A212T6T6_9MICO|nr:Nitrous oxidase accessory protein NosD, contains tandem CASH domains [Kytococcus aerolatus]
MAACSTPPEETPDRPGLKQIRDQLRGARPGETVRLESREGGHRLNRPLQVPTGVTLAGDEGALLYAAGRLKSAVILESGAHLSGLRIESRGAPLISGIQVVREARNVQIENCEVVGTSAALGIMAHGMPRDLVVKQCLLDGPATGVSLVGGGSGVRLEGVEVANWSQRGIYLQQKRNQRFSQVSVADCRISDLRAGGSSRYPLVVTGTRGYVTKSLNITRCEVTGPGRSYRDEKEPGTADQIAVRFAQDVEVADNTSVGGGDVGITVAHSRKVRVVRNEVRENDTAGIYVGSRFDSTAADILVEENVLVDNGQNRMGDRKDHGRVGIRVTSAKAVRVRRNKVVNTQGTQISGVTLENSPTTTLDDNTIEGAQNQIVRIKEVAGDADG